MTDLSFSAIATLLASDDELLHRGADRIAKLAVDPRWPIPPRSEAAAAASQVWYWRLYWYRSRFLRNPPDWVARLHWHEQSSWAQLALDADAADGISQSEWRARPKLEWPEQAGDLRDEAGKLLAREIERALKAHL